MKKNLLFSISLAAFFLPGCTKIFPSAVDKIEGDWRLKSAEKIALFNSTTISTGYENGRFSFLNDGSATYREGTIAMNGNWRMRKSNNWNNDDNGSDLKRRLTINLYEFTANRVLNLEFDDFHFNGRNRLVAKYQAPGYRYKYEFVRY